MYKPIGSIAKENNIQKLIDQFALNSEHPYVPLKEKFFYPCYSKYIEKKNYTGFFTRVPLKKGTIFSIEGGNLISKKIAPNLDGELLSMVFNEETYLYPSSIENMPPSWYTNHSCDPNMDIIGRLIYIINRDLEADTELTVDYAIALPEYDFTMECSCQSKNCRKKISGNDWRIPELAKERWLQWPPHIQKKIIEEKITGI